MVEVLTGKVFMKYLEELFNLKNKIVVITGGNGTLGS